jgi:hypothetical protein
MEIHKPKPWHGWREFLKEYLIIVVGVLTALGAEQLVEQLHWRERTAQTEETLRAELHLSVSEAAARLSLVPCTNAMLSRLEDAVSRTDEDWRPPYTIRSNALNSAIVITAPHGLWRSQAWRDAQADGTANHLPKDEALRFGELYETIASLKANNERETAQMGELNSLVAVRRMDPESRNQYLRAIYSLRQSLLGLQILSANLVQASKSLKVEPQRSTFMQSGAMPLYREMCRQFEAGVTDIVNDR